LVLRFGERKDFVGQNPSRRILYPFTTLLFCCLRFQESSDSAADLGQLAVFSLQITAKTAAALAAPPLA